MNEVEGYAVFFFPQALEALGEAIKPYLEEGPAGPHLMCREIDTGGALIEMTLADRDDGRTLGRELMVPTSMVRMIVSARSDEAFGFGPRPAAGPTRVPAAAAPAAPVAAPELAPPLAPDLAPEVAPELAPGLAQETPPEPADPAPAVAAPPLPAGGAATDAITAAPVDPAAATRTALR